MPEPLHGIVVLSAGASRRLGQPKQLLRHQGQSLVRRAVLCALSTAPADAVVVVGAQADGVFAEIDDLAVRRIDCVDWNFGMGASLRSGLSALTVNCAGALIVLCDQLHLDSSHLNAICSAWRATPDRAVASFYSGKLGVPALLPRKWFAEAEQIAADRGARDLLMRHDASFTPITNEALSIDIDTAGDLSFLHQ